MCQKRIRLKTTQGSKTPVIVTKTVSCFKMQQEDGHYKRIDMISEGDCDDTRENDGMLKLM